MNCLSLNRLNSAQSDLTKGTWSPCSLNSVFQTIVYEYFSGRNTLVSARSLLDAHSIDLSLHLLALPFNKCKTEIAGNANETSE